ncbi:MAG: DUF427 domain-containing protein [Gammaproteobacteria bacterium]|nr:DUF427 domain-containing protein [Gammaproteobacteria bacterium]
MSVQRARDKWRYRGDERPVFAEASGSDEESVWDFPRPPRLESVVEALRVERGERVVAATRHGVRILETAGAPTYYFPPEDVDATLLLDLDDRSECEWKGLATNFCLSDEPRDMGLAGWRYDSTFAEFESIRGWFAFHPGVLSCFIADEQVRPQPGGYYGGWVTKRLRGPVKGGPGSEAW